MRHLFHKLRQSALVRNTGWMLAGNGLRLVIQAAYFILVARSLGPQSYGAFAAAIAMVGIVSPFVGFGCGNLLVKHVARDHASFPRAWGNGLFLTLITGMLGIILVCACGTLWTASVPRTLLILVAVSELLLYKTIDLCVFAFGAFEMMGRCALVNAFLSMARLIAIASLTKFVAHPTATVWGGAYLVATAFAMLFALSAVRRNLGRCALQLHVIWGELREGLYFSVGLSATSIYNDIDKAMLARLGTLAATGVYAAAYRLVDVALVPVSSMLSAAYPRFFRKGVDGISATMAYAKQLFLWSITYSLVAFLLLVVCAPLVPRILGASYANSVESLRWLALLPVLKACHYLFANALTGAGLQGLRTLLQIVVAIFNVLINLWLIPAYSWRGAAWSSLMSDGLLALLMWTALILISRRERQTRVQSELSPLGDPTC
jgi:O-antigen/teichoic acid export membrane protein